MKRTLTLINAGVEGRGTKISFSNETSYGRIYPKKGILLSSNIVSLPEIDRLICSQARVLQEGQSHNTTSIQAFIQLKDAKIHICKQTHHSWLVCSEIFQDLAFFFLNKVASEKVSLVANTRKGGHFETLGKRLFIGPLALATFLLTFAQDAFLLHQTHKYKIQIQMQKHTHTYKSKR